MVNIIKLIYNLKAAYKKNMTYHGGTDTLKHTRVLSLVNLTDVRRCVLSQRWRRILLQMSVNNDIWNLGLNPIEATWPRMIGYTKVMYFDLR